MLRSWLRRAWAKLTVAAAVLTVFVALALSGGTVATVAVLEHTSKPQFCNTCHIMDPYYASWEESEHAHVGCIECHYEPGAVETFEGKLAALSQLAKYVTRTQGTKPWAEVSDDSCLRSGCHTVRSLEGPIAFGDVRFDHTGHLLDGRPGKQLRCVTCHSQVTQTEHFAVSRQVCYACHFMPGAEQGEGGQDLGQCRLCHLPPDEPLAVDGRAFHHGEYLERGVDCQECHVDVVQGRGTARPERCQSCHGEVELLARYGETTFLHEVHVTDNKVECFECHDVIHHGLEPRHAGTAESTDGCASCHAGPHDAAVRLYAGTGAVGVEDRPSRMYRTHVTCEGCHTGRAERLVNGGDSAGSAPHAVAAAGEVDCLHCHGIGFAGMLAAWQRGVGGRLERLEPRLAELEARATDQGGEAVRALVRDARHNLDLVRDDGSLGAHNVDYALDALRVASERLEEAAAELELETTPAPEAPFRSAYGCSTCHLGIEDAPVATPSGPFPHDRHLFQAGLDCDACHSVAEAEHGLPSLPRSECASCHHQESETFDAYDCAACHADQQGFLAGGQAGFDPGGPMTEKECGDCHGEPPVVMLPPPSLCVLCHEEGYERMPGAWTHEVEGLLSGLTPELERRAEAAPAAGSARELVEGARRHLELIQSDGSRGVHNVDHALRLLRSADQRLDEAAALVAPETAPPAEVAFPFQSAHGCSTCHLGIEDEPAVTADGRPFPHDRHLFQAGLDCGACHSVEEDLHGEPSPERADCVSCHHQESESFDAFDCAGCHEPQRAFVEGALAELAADPGPMAEKECGDCHGEPPAVMIPPPALCALCHDEDYEPLLGRWAERSDSLLEQVGVARAEAVERGIPAEDLAEADRRLEAVRADGSRGAHHFDLTVRLLEEALRLLEAR